MARINLLPWRQEVRERKNKEFLTVVTAVLLVSLLGAFAGWKYYDSILQSQYEANEKIKTENERLDKELKEIETLEQQRDALISRMKVIQDLQGRRPIPVRVWDDIARIMPATMYFNNMKRQDDVITFTGQADNPNTVADFVRKLDASVWLENSKVISMQQPDAVAYQTPQSLQPNPNNKDKTPKREYPEDKYLTFVVTTSITKATIASVVASTASATATTAPASGAKATTTAPASGAKATQASAPATAKKASATSSTTASTAKK